MTRKESDFILDSVGVFTIYEVALELGKSVEEVREFLRENKGASRPKRRGYGKGEGTLVKHLKEMFKTVQLADHTQVPDENSYALHTWEDRQIIGARERAKKMNNKELEAQKLHADHPWIENPQKFYNYIKELKNGTED